MVQRELLTKTSINSLQSQKLVTLSIDTNYTLQTPFKMSFLTRSSLRTLRPSTAPILLRPFHSTGLRAAMSESDRGESVSHPLL
jgi:hypothetical protein